MNLHVYYYNIRVLDPHRNTVMYLSWSGLKYELRLKYDWYFKYRAALLQVQYPKYEVQTFWGTTPAQGRTLAEMLEAKIRAKKAKITEYKNKIEAAEKNWARLFPIEHDPDYQRAMAKLQRLEYELLTLIHDQNGNNEK